MSGQANAATRKRLFLSAGLVVIAVAGVSWNEARKEIFYLCGNFAPGVSEASVRRQLETGTFLQHRTTAVSSGSRITVDSWYTLKTARCTIEIDSDNTVASAAFG